MDSNSDRAGVEQIHRVTLQLGTTSHSFAPKRVSVGATLPVGDARETASPFWGAVWHRAIPLVWSIMPWAELFRHSSTGRGKGQVILAVSRSIVRRLTPGTSARWLWVGAGPWATAS